MEFTDVCFISSDVLRLAKFYESLFQVKAELDPIHCLINGPSICIAIYDKIAAERDGMDFTNSGTGTSYLGFNCEDADLEYERIQKLNAQKLTSPKVWPWGAKSFQFLDPDNNLIVVRSWPI